MPRIRSVHPSLCEDETLAKVSASAERTFVRLWPHLDDDGRSVDRLKLFKARLYPEHDDMTPVEIDEDLIELEAVGLVIRYEVGGVRYLSAKPSTWYRYQKPQRKLDSKLPPIPDTYATPRVPVPDVQETGIPIARAVVVVGEGEGDVEGEGENPPSSSLSIEPVGAESQTDDDAEGSTLYLKIKTELLKSFEEEDARAALTVWWPRQSTGEKFTSPLSFCAKVAANFKNERVFICTTDPERISVIEGEEFRFDREDGHWHRVEAEVVA